MRLQKLQEEAFALVLVGSVILLFCMLLYMDGERDIITFVLAFFFFFLISSLSEHRKIHACYTIQCVFFIVRVIPSDIQRKPVSESWCLEVSYT